MKSELTNDYYVELNTYKHSFILYKYQYAS